MRLAKSASEWIKSREVMAVANAARFAALAERYGLRLMWLSAVVSAVMGVVALVLVAIVVHTASIEHRLRQEGIAATAKVLDADRHSYVGRHGKVELRITMTYEFLARDGRPYKRSITDEARLLELAANRGEIAVRYLPGDPGTSAPAELIGVRLPLNVFIAIIVSLFAAYCAAVVYRFYQWRRSLLAAGDAPRRTNNAAPNPATAR